MLSENLQTVVGLVVNVLARQRQYRMHQTCMLLSHWKQDVSESTVLLSFHGEDDTQAGDVVVQEDPVTFRLESMNQER